VPHSDLEDAISGVHNLNGSAQRASELLAKCR
jgi:hypothetical protein